MYLLFSSDFNWRFFFQVNCLEPHPHLPVLAVSGLDHSVKICTPYSTRPMDTEHLKEVREIKRIRTKRETIVTA